MTVFRQYYGLATGAILFYDYLLTLEDEVCPLEHLATTY